MDYSNQKPIAGIFILLALLFVNCGKSEQNTASQTVAIEFMKFLNQRLEQFEGIKMETDLDKSQVKKIQGDWYQVTLKDVRFTSDTGSILKFFIRSFDTLLQDDAPIDLDVLDIEEVQLGFDRRKQKFNLIYAKGIKTDRDMSNMSRKNYKVDGIIGQLMNLNLKRARLYIEDVAFKDFQGDILLSDKKTMGSGEEIPDVNVTGINFIFNLEGDIVVKFRLQGVKNNKQGYTDESLFRFIMEKNVSTLDIAEILAKGMPVSDSYSEYGPVTLEITKQNRQIANATLDGISTMMYFGICTEEKDQADKHMVFRSGYGVNNLRLTFRHPVYNSVSVSLKKGDLIMSLDHLNPRIIVSFAEFMKKSIELRDSSDQSSVRRFLKMKGEQHLAELANSKKLANGFTINFDDLKVTCPLNKTLETLGDVRQCRLNFTVETDDPKSLAKYFKPSPDTLDKLSSMPAVSPDMLMNGMKFLPVLLKSGMRIKYSISPLKHYFGELSIESSFQSKPMAMKSEIKIKRMSDFFNKLTASGLVPSRILMLLRLGLMQTAVVDAQGNASIQFEIKPDEPNVMYLNGHRIPFPMNMLNRLPNLGFGR